MFFKQKFWLARLISGSIGKLIKDKGSRVLMYHSIGAKMRENISNIYEMEEDVFRSHMKHIKGLSNRDVLPLSDWEKDGDALIITFDDGFKDSLMAATILSSLNFPFTVFVSPSLVKSGEIRYLNTKELIELSRLSHCTIGSHGYSHSPLAKLDDVKLKQELKDSKDWLENLLSIPINVMSYPFGSVNERVRDAVEVAEYKIAVCSRPGANRKGEDPLTLSRTDVWSIDSKESFNLKINGNWDWMKYIL